MSSNSVEIYLKAIEFLGKRGGLLGMNIIQPEYKLINFKSLLVILDTITYTLVTIYCMFEFAGDLERMVFCLVTYGFGIQGNSKLKTFWLGHKTVSELNKKIIDHHRSLSNNKSKIIFEKYAKFSSIACKVCNHLYILVGVGSFMNPIAVKLLTGNLVLPYGFKLPMIDEFSFFGYTINLLHHFIQVYVVASGYILCDGLYACFVLHVYSLYDNLSLMLDELNDTINGEDLMISSEEIRSKLVTIVQLHNELLSFLQFMENFFKQNILVCIFSNVFQIVCCLFALVVSQWYIGAFFLLALSFQIFILCIFGTFVMFKNENLRMNLYNIKWYRLDVRDQKTLLLILIKANEDVNFTFCVGVLNFESFVSIYEKIYSFFMMLVNFRS